MLSSKPVLVEGDKSYLFLKGAVTWQRMTVDKTTHKDGVPVSKARGQHVLVQDPFSSIVFRATISTQRLALEVFSAC